MSVLRTIGTATRQVGIHSVVLIATMERDDQNGQLFLRVAATIDNGETIDRKHSIGADDGNDAIAGLTPAAIAAQIQPDLDALRQQVTQIVVIRLGVMAAGTQLV